MGNLSNDLISRSALLEEINSDENKKADRLMREWYANMVSRQPAAYDVDKVIEQLEENAKYFQGEADELAQKGDWGTATDLQGRATAYKDSAEIVKSGGVADK